MDGIILYVIAVAGIAGLCAAPLTLRIRAGAGLRVEIRYLRFRRSRTNIMGPALRLLTGNYAAAFRACTRFLRRPMRIRRFYLKIEFSVMDAAEAALAYGVLRLLPQVLCMRLADCKPEIVLSPRFPAPPEISLDCDISLSLPAVVFLLRRRALFENLRFSNSKV
ncbi:MAG: hypothetical protein LBO04_01740 [Spirochaetaceae bacterium]|jgi:hypothetical protein|nr:hypothetical protein [Spirochaetaceae bacterium]